MDKPTGRVVALLVLLLLVAAALRGYLPAHHHAARSESGGRIALVFVVSALAVALALVAIAVIARLRDPRAPTPGPSELSDMLGTGKGRPSWRVLLIGLAVIAAWLLLVMLLARLLGPHGIGSAPTPADTGAPPPAHPNAPPQQQEQHRPHDNSGDVLGILLAGTVVMLLVFVAGSVAAARRRWRPAFPSIVDEPFEAAAPPTRSESLARAAERGLAEMTDLSREPREAIIACYAAMERELANVPGAAPQDFDTPTEVLARAVEHHALHADNAVQLVNLFAEARFSPHVMNEGHRDVAAHVLRLVLDELGSRSAA
jgi:hypothetical protein